MEKKYDVFISYSHQNTKTMYVVKNHLESKGLKTWHDEGITPGTQNWQIAIENAIRNSDAIVVLLSPESSSSKWVREELGFAQNLGKKVYPILIGGDETNAVPFGYSKSQWIDIRRKELVTSGLERLYNALTNQDSPVLQKSTTTKNIPKWLTIAITLLIIGLISYIILNVYQNSFDNSDMKFVEEGHFTMGFNENPSNESLSDHEPAHEVYLNSFWIDKYEVTNSEYLVFIKETNHTPPAHWENSQYLSGSEMEPVVGVTWYDAKQFCEWNNGKRLPTEAEWEKAARGTDERIWPWNGDWEDGKANTYESGENRLASVGSHPGDISPFGVMDMAGNAQEWVSDWYQDDYYQVALNENPPGPIDGDYKVVRGGAYNWPKEVAMTYYRIGFYPPSFPEPGIDSLQGSVIGFRCACDDKCN